MLCFFFQAKYDGQVCVLKEFNLREEKDKALFLNEVKRLRTLQHPCVVSVEAVFVNSVRVHSTMATLGFIQLPFYAGGDLGRWLVAPERISDAKKQLVLRTALQGLMYVHERGIVHCDVKPANIFVTREGTGVLGDFDISQNAETRATMASSAATRAVVGLTWDYAAPESVSTPATKVTNDVAIDISEFTFRCRRRICFHLD